MSQRCAGPSSMRLLISTISVAIGACATSIIHRPALVFVAVLRAGQVIAALAERVAADAALLQHAAGHRRALVAQPFVDRLDPAAPEVERRARRDMFRRELRLLAADPAAAAAL